MVESRRERQMDQGDYNRLNVNVDVEQHEPTAIMHRQVDLVNLFRLELRNGVSNTRLLGTIRCKWCKARYSMPACLQTQPRQLQWHTFSK